MRGLAVIPCTDEGRRDPKAGGLMECAAVLKMRLLLLCGPAQRGAPPPARRTFCGAVFGFDSLRIIKSRGQ
jgi:hypothetical protein